MKPWFSFTLLALTSGVLSASTGARLASISLRARDASIRIADSVMNTPAYDLFRSPDTRTVFRTTKEEAGMVKRKYSRHSQKLETEEQLRKRIALDGGYVYLLQCTDAGFRGDCLVFGSKPGSCVSYFDFNGNKTQNDSTPSISDTYNHKVSSISTNTGGVCMFFHYKGCNVLGNDRGLTSSYNYDLSNTTEEDPRIPEYENNITSWRC